MSSSRGDDSDVRRMNDTTMPPPPKSKVPSRALRSKVTLRKGFGMHDWTRLLRSSKDLAQRNGAALRRDITRAEVRQHSKEYDGWIVLHGKVYNIGPYIPYHPGGMAILKPVLGKDATELFNKYHQWVNVEGLIGPLLLGYVHETRGGDDEDDSRAPSYLPSQAKPNDGFAVPAPRPKTVPVPLLFAGDDEEEDKDPLDDL
mmetsp:Transcript_40232/g.59669  ORF Transcript_40232/g.59669 Transcript_40232/m.59669 type:complete len:201 (-) Transcript_40232:247-849(-)|eukprot:CAMPEP_0194036978 /NCGR_PEP_ID=MMETSP0009_2-20130614/9357_1 /TAXON_ID=210454 /ORGANISM="Grammatophora oceanica, Strain CCMP 410" /LENGTH=200 /DNA_ID=CAMNT_0038678961 /DNA_START=67 /DNA_END=669 /DNA_ORIENTATION=+